MSEEIRDDEIIIDKYGLNAVKTSITRYWTFSLRTALIIILIFSIAAWGGVFFLGFGFGTRLCGGN